MHTCWDSARVTGHSEIDSATPKTVSLGIADDSGVKSPDLFDWARTAYEDIHESPRA